MRASTQLRRRRRPLIAAAAVLTLVGALGFSGTAVADDGGVSDRPILGIWEVQSLNGVNNNPFSRKAGSSGVNYLRISPARYVDGKSQMVSGPNPRNVSNRVFNDENINVFSERGVSQWGFVWGQFLDHTFGLREEFGTTSNLTFNANDPLESFRNDLGYIPFLRSVPAPNTGVTNTRQHVNTVSSFIDTWAVYGGTDARLDWTREGSQDGNPDNNGGRLLMPSNYLPRRDARGNPAAAPIMEINGRLLANPNAAVVAGDVRANENISLTATHTLFAREHNRIVAQLPSWMSQQDKFQIARAVVIAEQQHITYTEFLPSIGVTLPAYRGYNPFLNPAMSHEMASFGYRAHSMIHGEVEMETNVSRYSQATLDALEAQGVELTIEDDDIEIGVPLNVGFFNPNLVRQLQLGPLLQGIGLEPQYKNDEQIDNQLRSVLFQIPIPGNPECLDGPTLPECFKGVLDLSAIDIQRGRDHGMPSYNTVRQAFGLPAKTSFTAITGESTEAFPADPLLTKGNEINDPNCLDVMALFDREGNPTNIDNDDAVVMIRRCTLAARLKAIFGSVSNLDAFTGMLAEKHLAGSELGELQRAVWADQFRALRDGDRFFYRNDPLQSYIRQHFGIDSRKTLAQIIALNTDIPLGDLEANVFFAPTEEGLAAASSADVSAATGSEPQPSDMTRRNKNTPAGASMGGEMATVPGESGPRSLGRRRRYRDRE